MPTTFRSDPFDIVELRQYTLHPGQRDGLIELFDREFVEPQEALGMTVCRRHVPRSMPEATP